MHRIWTPNPVWEGFINRVIERYKDAEGER